MHGRRRTPHVAILVLFVIIALLQFAGDITQLAGATVLLLLIVFTIVNAALVVLKRRDGDMPGRFNAPVLVPMLGAAVCLVMIGGQVMQSDWRGPAIAIGMIAAIGIAYLLSPQRGKAIPET